jgi:aerobic carbon-monoxide dehydrogenase medium subunit
MKPARFEYARAEDASSALSLLKDESKFMAGGQSLGPMLNLRVVQPGAVVDVRRIPELLSSSEDEGSVTLGAGITHAQVEDRKVPDPSRGFMPFVASRIAYRAVRNRGTLGGSLAHADPAADWPTALALLGGTAIIQGKNGRREAPLDRFVTGLFSTVLAEGELLVAVKIPKLSAQARWGYWKFCRKAGEFAQAIGGALRDPASGRVRAVLGAVQGAPHVIADARNCDPEAEAARVCADPYDRRLHAVALQRAIAALEEPR